MAEMSEEKRFLKALNTYNRNGGNNALLAYHFVTHATITEMDRTLDLCFHIIRELATLNMEGYVTAQKAEIVLRANAVMDALLRENYIFQ